MGNSNTSSMNHSEGYSEKLRVLIVDLSIRYGGASTRAISIAKNFSSYGGMIAVIENSPVMKIALEQKIPVRVVGKKRTDLLIPFRIAKIIKEEGIQVVDTQNIQSKFWVSIAVLFSKVAFVSTLNSLYSQEFGTSWKSKVYHWIDRLTNVKTDRYVAVSNAIEKSLLDDRLPREKISLIRNAVSLPSKSSDFDIAKTRKQFGIPENAFVFTLLGRMVWAKGIDDFISAFSIVAEKYKPARAVIVGDGELRDEIVMQIKKSGLQEHVYLLGYQSHQKVLEILMSSNVFVMPSRSEGIPYALLEAAALGMPIIATHCGGIPEVVTDDESAILVPIGDVKALSKVMASLSGDQSLANRLGKAAQNKIANEYALDKQMEIMEDIYWQTYKSRFQ
jgi:glycosyltransferase involved in cell wall biosynthesis